MSLVQMGLTWRARNTQLIKKVMCEEEDDIVGVSIMVVTVRVEVEQDVQTLKVIELMVKMVIMMK